MCIKKVVEFVHLLIKIVTCRVSLTSDELIIISLYYYSIRIRRIIRAYHEETGETYEQQFAHRNAPDFYLDFLPWIKGEQTFVNFLRCRSAELDNAMVRRFSGIGLQPGPCPKEALKLAKSNIENYFSVVGLQEHYKESVQLIRSAFQLELTDYHVNKGVDRQTSEIKLSIEDRMRIKQMNKMDTDLYKWIKSRFDKQLVDTPSPILVPGGGRTDFDQATLWHAIGNSPIRQKAMEQNPAVFKK